MILGVSGSRHIDMLRRFHHISPCCLFYPYLGHSVMSFARYDEVRTWKTFHAEVVSKKLFWAILSDGGAWNQGFPDLFHAFLRLRSSRCGRRGGYFIMRFACRFVWAMRPEIACVWMSWRCLFLLSLFFCPSWGKSMPTVVRENGTMVVVQPLGQSMCGQKVRCIF